MLCVALFLAAFMCVHIYMQLLCRRERAMLRNLPTYSCLPFIGNTHWFIGEGKRAMRHLNEVSQIADRAGKPFVIWVGHHCLLVLSSIEDTKTVANAFLEKPSFYKFAQMWLGDGLLTAPGHIWKKNVKKIKATFNVTMVDDFLPIFNMQADQLVTHLKNEDNLEPFDLMHKYLAFITLEAIFQTAISKNLAMESSLTKDYYIALQRLLELIFNRAINIFLHPEIIYRFTPAYQEMKKHVDLMDTVSNTIINKRRKELQSNKRNKTTKEPRADPKSFLDTLLELSFDDEILTEKRIQDEVNTIMLAGQETVTTVINFVFLMLGCKPDVQRKLYNEIQQVFGKDKRTVMKEDLPRLRYCEAVIFETMRLLPPVPAILRYADRDLDLESCTIPKGATCCVNMWGLGRSQRLWADPLSYRPERWLQPGTELPILNFSMGRRACIGKRYAMSLMKIIIVHCIRELEFTSEAEQMALRFDVTLRPIHGNLVRVRVRDDA